MKNKQSEMNKTFWPNGQLKRTVPFIDGVQSDGEVISYHYNGLKSRSVNLSGGKYNGPITTWWENGNLKSKLLLKNDCPIEELIIWDPNGAVIGKHDASKYIVDGIDALNENNHLLSKELLDLENIFSDLTFDRDKEWNLKLGTQLMIIGEFDSEKEARDFQNQFVEQNHFEEKHNEDYWSKDEYDIVRRKNLIIIASRRYFDAKSIDFTYDDNAAEIVEIDWVQGVGLVQIPHDESDQLTFLTPTLISEQWIRISCEGSEFIAKYLCDQIIAMNGGANAFRLADNSNEFDLMFAFIGPEFFISIENQGVMIQKHRRDVQEDFWIKIVHDRVQSMDREKLKRWGAESLSDVASMHYEEYRDRISDKSSAEKLEFSRIRMRGFGKAYENFIQQLAKEEYSDSLGRKELDDLIFHAHASFLGAMQIALDAGLKEDELEQITPEEIMKQIQDKGKEAADKHIEVQGVASALRDLVEEFEFTPGDKLNEFSYDQLRKGNYNVAISNARKALEKTPNHAPFLDTLAFALFLNDEYKSALDISNQAIELDIKSGELNPEHLSTRIKIYQALSNHPKVKEDEKRLNEIAPDYNDPLHVLEIITIKKQNS